MLSCTTIHNIKRQEIHKSANKGSDLASIIRAEKNKYEGRFLQ